MSKWLFKVVCAVLFTTSTSGLWAQDIHFSQFFEAPLLRNPSLAGIFTGDLRFQTVFRTQWGAVTDPYQTGSFNGEYKMPVGSNNDFVTWGGQFVYDKAGATDFKTVQFLPAINYHKSLSGDRTRYLSAGFMGGYVQRSIDRSKITTNSQFDGSGFNPALLSQESLVNYSLGYWDGSAGISYNSSIGNDETNQNNNFFIGAAYHHFNRPKNSFYRSPGIELEGKWVYSVGLHLQLSDRNFFTLQGDYSKQGAYKEVIGGVLYTIALGDLNADRSNYNIHVGAFSRWKDAIIPVVKLDYLPFSISFSYDINISQLKTASQGRGGFEVSISHISFFDRVNSTRNAVVCPRF
ncbi:MAG: type IX secretion system membrane protein PorP/SprF [Hymenobacter sp.]|nr:MAG: type IX secretion system membrane protein PorP/SprF [Hymenobacter sp.]